MKSLTSDDVVRSASQSKRGSTLTIMSALTSSSSCTNSASLGCSGCALGVPLQALMAHVTKLSVSTFMTNERMGNRVCWERLMLVASAAHLQLFSIEKSLEGPT